MKIVSLFLFAVLLTDVAQAKEYPFDRDVWKVSAVESEVVEHLGQPAMRIKGGYAQINDLSLRDGVIEFDIAVTSERGFAGAVFRVQDLENYEHFYIRPHQSGKADANQYTPVFNGVSAWQLYHGPAFGSPVIYRFNEWMHVRIAFAGDRAEVFIDSDEPVLVIDDLRRDSTAGGIGLGAGNFAPAYFANFAVSPLPADHRFKQSEVRDSNVLPGTVLAWEVSNGMAADDDAAAEQLAHKWTTLAAEPTGITNLAMAPNLGEHRTVLARLRLKSAERQQVKLAFGYSDAVVVSVNGEPMYEGNNRYRSRDYRYLGTIGLFDTAYLPLKPGENEVVFKVTEAFGGWGIQARFEDMTGITLAVPTAR